MSVCVCHTHNIACNSYCVCSHCDYLLICWKRYEKMEKEHRKKAEKEALEQKKRDDELRDVC